MKYSIIIPVYNSEATLRRCLDSLLADSRSDVELLLIDDGSTDGSPAICREYEGRDPRIRVLKKAHEGVSAARNCGLEQARGTYILFADSDDYAEPDYFGKLDRVLVAGDPEMVFFSYRLVGESVSLRVMPDYLAQNSAAVLRFLSAFLRRRSKGALWAKVFLRSVIEAHKLRFDPALDIDEDVCFVFSYALCVSRLKTTGEILYNNCIDNAESLTRRKRDYLCDQLHHAGLRRYEMVRQSESAPEARRELRRSLAWLYYRGAYSSAAELMKYDLDRGERITRLKTICAVFDDYPDSQCRPLISVPVRLRLVGLMDLAARFCVCRRKL